MSTAIREAGPADHDAVVELALQAWAPVFASVNDMLGPELANALHDRDWRGHQANEVREALSSDAIRTWVAELDGSLAGFVGARVIDPRRLLGEIYILGVAPQVQRRGVGAALTEHASQWLAEQGMRVVYISTGGDPGHAAARRLYERLGFQLFPSAQYFQVLRPEP